MARMIYCSSSKENLKPKIMKDIESGNISGLFKDLQLLVNEYNHSVKFDRYWMNASKVKETDNRAKFHNYIVDSAKIANKTLYTDKIETARWQIECVVECLKEYSEKLSEKERNSILRKIETRTKKMI